MLEKNICLSVGKKLAQQLQQKGFEVILTRVGDYTVSLDQRTTQANTHSADFFISIHANYAASNKAHGIETFCFDSSLLTNQLSICA